MVLHSQPPNLVLFRALQDRLPLPPPAPQLATPRPPGGLGGCCGLPHPAVRTPRGVTTASARLHSDGASPAATNGLWARRVSSSEMPPEGDGHADQARGDLASLGPACRLGTKWRRPGRQAQPPGRHRCERLRRGAPTRSGSRGGRVGLWGAGRAALGPGRWPCIYSEVTTLCSSRWPVPEGAACLSPHPSRTREGACGETARQTGSSSARKGPTWRETPLSDHRPSVSSRKPRLSRQAWDPGPA